MPCKAPWNMRDIFTRIGPRSVLLECPQTVSCEDYFYGKMGTIVPVGIEPLI